MNHLSLEAYGFLKGEINSTVSFKALLHTIPSVVEKCLGSRPSGTAALRFDILVSCTQLEYVSRLKGILLLRHCNIRKIM